MNSMQKLVAKIPHEFRRSILLEWIPTAKPTLANASFKILWEAYFIYVDPNGVKKENCPICLNNVLENWKNMQKYLIEIEQEYSALDQL